MSDFKYRLYGKIQWAYHAIKGRNIKSTYKVYYVYDKSDSALINGKNCIINGNQNSKSTVLFKGDNIIEEFQPPENKGSKLGRIQKYDKTQACDAWLEAIKNAKVEDGWRNSGFYLTAYTKENDQWCLSNWIWTSAAIARVLSKSGLKDEARDIADAFLREQLPCGGWIVRYDFVDGHLNQLIAPNDSAYIARNALLYVYEETKESKYLSAAEKCAKWIMDTCCEDGLVLFGYSIEKGEWIKDRNIVDIGFTADLFAELFTVTKKDIYLEFMNRFIDSFINTFYVETSGLFASHVNENREKNGGYFSRGQAWAMEGLIAAYSVTEDKRIYSIMENMTRAVIANQLKNGGWYCNFQKSRSLMGEDCKGISAIACSLLRWAEYSENKDYLVNSGRMALKWCENHTDGKTGTILSFSCNGAIAHSPNTSTGILYANAYAIELYHYIKNKDLKD